MGSTKPMQHMDIPVGQMPPRKTHHHRPSSLQTHQSIKTPHPTGERGSDIRQHNQVSHTQTHGLPLTQLTPTTQVPSMPTRPAEQATTPKRRAQSLPIGTPRQDKVSRLYVVKPDFDVLYADLVIKLANTYYLLYGVVDSGAPVIRIQDCAYTKRSVPEGVNFVPRSVKFTPQQWSDLLGAAEEITNALEGFDEAGDNVRVHIGRNTFITVKPQQGVVDIREFFLPKDAPAPAHRSPESYYDSLIPTKRGVYLSARGWAKLISKGIDMIHDFAAGKIIVTQPCYTMHQTDEALFTCQHCNPNGPICE
jgi:hypothetical protein